MHVCALVERNTREYAVAKLFSELQSKFTAKSNFAKVHFQLIVIDLDANKFSLIKKPNKRSFYMINGSNHPSNILRNLICCLCRRLSLHSPDSNVLAEAE